MLSVCFMSVLTRSQRFKGWRGSLGVPVNSVNWALSCLKVMEECYAYCQFGQIIENCIKGQLVKEIVPI